MPEEKPGTPMTDEQLRAREEMAPDLDFENRDTFELPFNLDALGKGRAPMIENTSPLQRVPGLVLQHQAVIGGPESPMDIRLSLSVDVLESMLEAARRSRTKRCVVHNAGIIVETWYSPAEQHQFQELKVVGRKPAPEDPLILRNLTGLGPG